ncbi:hypothetical protein B0T26DRAFT_693046 [Lasiosphaeria miniovina]|uniref:Uncharacterized protein n=1 Tax=Lasiosphaeria miniovina TaxID=1954250 RepID=A0AA40E9A2_9PEZI|nr:uncharacterized protein B0T26DRAFT_693046 [Lasiosphaeria miniovina]KAK0727098.1 hypothetical protein B0T26DRAFT_693046 [Lasiosphaeria miniovina]
MVNINTRHQDSIRVATAKAFLGFDSVYERTLADDIQELINKDETIHIDVDYAGLGDHVLACSQAREETRDRAAEVHISRAERNQYQDVCPNVFRVGDWVRDKLGKEKSKFTPNWSGPWRVVEKVMPRTCIVEHTRKPGPRRKLHVDDMKLHGKPPLWGIEPGDMVVKSRRSDERWLAQLESQKADSISGDKRVDLASLATMKGGPFSLPQPSY